MTSTGVRVFSLMGYAGYLQPLRVELLLSLEASDKVATSKSWSLKVPTCDWFTVPRVWEDGQKFQLPLGSWHLLQNGWKVSQQECPLGGGSWETSFHPQQSSQLEWLPPSSGDPPQALSWCSCQQHTAVHCSLQLRGSAWRKHEKQPLCAWLPNFYQSPICLVI